MVCERLTDEQRDTVERWHGYAMRSAMRWAAACGKLADCDDFKSAGNDALIRCVQLFDKERGGKFENYFGRLLQQEVSRVLRQHYGGGLIAASGKRDGVKTGARIPMTGRSFEDIAEPSSVSDDFEILEIEEAYAMLSEQHKWYLDASIDGTTCVQLSRIRGTTKSNEGQRMQRARAAFAELMGGAS